MLLKLITVSALSIGLATSAMAQASGGSGSSGSGTTSGSGNTGGSAGQNQNTSGNFNGGTDAAGGDIRESSDCVQGKTATNKAGKPVPGTAKRAGGNCQ
ncbi:hypothetical protein [Rhizobium sp. P32RR-XVIII]|uniref:hypothetical protein n=1 Tax=Rhizobium sp. P32RR-XVIII TaxID=2726738 RepID=UPI0019826875|nr:hypothetical protein [Rhizobium sp. P32RR-XVIII]